ncbi:MULTISPECIES: enoyl-CoA hydratase/isomerase family protein [unclassified Sphingomonas]|jgi:enoyl-CoA hydratase/carnithine racemase|uniref:enoyl-CoA hydratase/isomerase family protein n=1 Tax=unclassified Sphingomonas TaxID=196159 RepID=UPI0009E81D38|nr:MULTISPECIES: enoyl-CoA hydratase-related protein [unclassified Sphingomonas]
MADVAPPVLVTEFDGGVRLTLNRPGRRNAVDEAMLDLLDQAFRAAAADPAVRVVTITGAGAAFCAGADLHHAMQAGPEGIAAFVDRAGRVYNAIRNFPKPVVAALNGLTIAGGLELALACDIIVAVDGAMIGDGHANFGMFPGAGGAALLPTRIGYHAAMHLLCTGALVPAARMMELGLIQQIAPAADFPELLARIEHDVASKSATALAAIKRLARHASCAGDEAMLDAEYEAFAAHLDSDDFAEGLQAFAEKRAPRFNAAAKREVAR